MAAPAIDGATKTDMKNETKLKHTPAPWKWGNALDARQSNGSPWPMLQSDDPDAGWIAMTADPDGPDARLIAAAPELLDALSEMVAVMHALWDHQEELCKSGDIPRNTMANKPMMNAANMATDALTKAIGENQE